MTILFGVIDEQADKQEDEVIGKGCYLFLEQVEQVFEIFDDGDICFQKGSVDAKDVLQVGPHEFNNRGVLE